MIEPLNGLEFSGLVTAQKPCPSAPTLRDTEAAGNTSDVNVDQQLLGESACVDSLPDISCADVPLLDFPPHDVPLPEARPDHSVHKA